MNRVTNSSRPVNLLSLRFALLTRRVEKGSEVGFA